MAKFRVEGAEPATPTEAARLHRMYGRVATSTLADWKWLSERYPYADLLALVEWLKRKPPGLRPETRWLKKHYPGYRERMLKDVSVFPVDQEAKDLAEAIAQEGNAIDAPYVAHCLQVYRGFLKHIQENGSEQAQHVYTMLPAPKAFGMEWFCKINGSHSPSYRQFRVDHPLFTKLGQDICRGAGFSDKWMKWVQGYQEKLG